MGCGGSKAEAGDGATAKPVAKAKGSVGALGSEVSKLKEGDYFGEIALLTDQGRVVSVQSVGDTKCLTLDRDTFDRLLGPLKDLLRESAGKYEGFAMGSSKDATAEAAGSSPDEHDDGGEGTPLEAGEQSELAPVVMAPPDKKENKRYRKRGSVFVESYDPSKEWTPKVIVKDADVESKLSELFGGSLLLKHLEADQKKLVIGCMEEKTAKAGDNIIKQGDAGDFFYIIFEGSADCFVKKDDAAEPAKVFSYSTGGTFGELALLHGDPRAATVTATSDCRMFALDRETFRRVLLTSAFKQQQRQEQFCKKVDILQSLSKYEIFRVAESLNPVHFKDGDVICKQGDAGDNFYIIESGSVACFKQ